MEQNLEPSRWKWIKTGKHQDLNLENEKGDFLLSEVNIASEFREWLSSYNLNIYSVIFVYGSAIGYPILELLPWLNFDKSRRLVLLEDDPELYKKLVEREDIYPYLDHPQVSIYLVNEEKEEILFHNLSQLSGIHQTLFIGSPSASSKRTDYYKTIYEFIRFGYLTYINEFLDGAESHFKNFYKNLPRYVVSSNLSSLFNHFEGIPALVVGAGPSLGKNIEIIKKLKNKALILSGGTAVNGLNAAGIDPHLSIGLDPFVTTISRSLASTSFMTPFIYKERMNAASLSNIHGPLIYLDAGITFLIERWFQDKFNIVNHSLEMGTNVLNAAISVAYKLGSKKIIMAGIDLALSENKVYAPKIRKHGTTVKSISAMGIDEEILVSKDIYGKPINTVKKWLRESIWIGDFQLKHPDAQLINSTEGGIGFPHINNIPLKHVQDLFLGKNYDIDGLIHALITTNPVGVTRQKLKDALVEFITSLGKVLSALIRLGAEDPELKQKYQLDLSQLSSEIAYNHFLKEFEEIYDHFYEANVLSDGSLTPYMANFRKKIPYLIYVCQLHLRMLSEMYEEWEKETSFERAIPQKGEIKQKFEKDESRYYYNDTLLAKTDWRKDELGEYAIYYYLDGKVAVSKKYKEGLLHGPILHYYPDGIVSAELQYDKGILDGVQKLFFPNGKIKRSIEFKDGNRDGADLIYNFKGNLINESYYKDDLPIGQAYIYHPNKKKALEVHYNDQHEIQLSQEWDEKGNPKNEKTQDYIGSVTGGTILLGAGISSIHSEFEKVIQKISKDPELAKDVKALENEFEKLKDLSQLLDKSSKKETLNTPQLKETLKRELTKYHIEMGDIFSNIEQQMKELKEKLEP